MMKRVCILLLIILMALSVVDACGTKKGAQNSDSVASSMVLSETVEVSEANQKTNAINMTVSTDTTDFTLEEAEFTIACLNGLDDTYLLPKEYDASEDADNPFVAPVGKTLVALVFSVTNHDRTSLRIADSVGWRLNWNVVYNGEELHLKGQGENDYNIILRHALLREGDGGWERADTQNKFLEPGETLTVRTFGVIDKEVNELTDSFMVVVNVPSSEGDKTFTYEVE